MEKQEQDAALAAAVRRFVQHAADRPDAPAEKPPSWLQFANLLLIAACAGLLLHLLGDRLQSPFLDVLAKTIPAIFGVTLAVYLDRWRGWLLSVTKHRRTTAVTFLLGLFLAALSFVPIRVDVVVHPSAQLSLDGRVLVPRDVAGQDTTREIVRMVFHGLQPRSLRISETDGAVEVIDSLTLRPGDAWRAFWGRNRLAVNAGHRVVIVSDGRPARIVVTGVFPDLYLARIAASHPVRRLRKGNASVYFRMFGGMHGGDGFRLPAGTYRVSIRRTGCREVVTTLVVRRFVENDLDYREFSCSPA